MLDVLASAILASEIRKSRLAVLTGLVRRYEAGSFDPAPGLHLAERRRHAAALEATQRKRVQKYAQMLKERAQTSDGGGRAEFQQVLKQRNWGPDW